MAESTLHPSYVHVTKSVEDLAQLRPERSQNAKADAPLIPTEHGVGPMPSLHPGRLGGHTA